MAKRILPPQRPKRDNAALDAVISHFGLSADRANLIFVRGYYLDSMGRPGVDDDNIYDDAAFIVSPNLRESFNANTGPSFPHKGAAKLDLGLYKYYRGVHKGRIKALRPYPEGVVLKCTRNGRSSTCSHTNIHDGGSNPAAFDVVWSLGCLTIPKIQYPEWQARVYREMDLCPQEKGTGNVKTIDVVLIENRLTDMGQAFFDGNGKIISA